MKDCKFCDKKGLLILLLRYAAVVGEAGLEDLLDLPATLGVGVKDLQLAHGKYAPRLLREGYVYMLVVRRGIKSWEGYAVTEDGFLYRFPVDTPPISKIEFSCDTSSCGIDASCVAIDKVDEVSQVYFLFTPSALTVAKLAEYKANAESYAAKGKMQVFDPKAWVRSGSRGQEHSLKPELIGRHVPEWQLYKQAAAAADSPLGKTLKQQLFPALSAAYAGLPPPAPDQPAPGRLGLLLDKLKRLEGAAFVLHDPIGITQELNDFRNAALEGVEHYLQATDTYGASNQQRLQVYEAIQEVKAGLHAGVVQNTQQFLSSHQQQSDAWFQGQLAMAQRLREDGREADARSIEDGVARSLKTRTENYAKALEASKAQAAQQWRSKYESRLDVGEMNTFYSQLNAHMAKAFNTVETRAAQHLQWFRAERLVNAFDTYDPKNLPAGYAFAAHAALCTYGIAGCKAAEPDLEEWIKATDIQRNNLYMRGFVYNQEELIQAAKQANRDIQDAVGTVEVASAISPALMVKATKGLVDGFKKVDSAFDEWVRNQGQDFSRKWSKSAEAVLYHKVSEMTRAVFRSGMGGAFDKLITARISGLLFAKLRAVSGSIAYDEILLSLPKEKVAAHRRARAERRAEQRRSDKAATQAARVASQVDDSLAALIADAQAKARQSPSLNELRNSKNPPTNNYHQTRLGVVLGCIEMIALGEKLTHFENTTKGYLEVVGSVMAVGSIVLDTYYSAAKAIREIEPYRSVRAINQGADIVRGGFKLGAGVLGMGAGVCGVVLDYMKMSETDDRALKSIYGLRSLTGLISAGLTMAAAFSYTSPLLERVATGYAKNSVRNRAINAAAGVAARMATRVRLLVWVARMSWVGLAFTAIEIGYLWIRDNELQDWCEKCVFRKDKTYNNWLGRPVQSERFGDVTRELEALEKAQQAIGFGG